MPLISLWTKARRAQNEEDFETWIAGGVSPTLNAFDNATETRATVLIIDGTRVGDVRVYEDEVMQTVIQRWGTGGGNVPMIQSENVSVRRLTPTECERLQGFPDGWTAGQADSNRYKQMGNAVAVPVVQWIINNVVGE
jgi:site-specific DNA-cytosine methylase